MPISVISRATVQRATSNPSRTSRRRILRTPDTRRFSSQARRITGRGATSRRARSDRRVGSARFARRAQQVEGAIGSTARIGPTPCAPPCASPCASTNPTIASTGGRARPSRNMRSTIVLGPMADNGLALAQDPVRLAKLAVLAFRRLRLPGHLGGDACAPAAVGPGLADPVVQRVRRATDLGGNRHDRLPAGPVPARAAENRPHSALAHFR